MIEEWSEDRKGFARFSDDRVMRYRLQRTLTPDGVSRMWIARTAALTGVKRVVFVMLNPSTADAFKVDPTVAKCCQFALRWGADVLEVVNLFAFRSPHPSDLYFRASTARDIGADLTNTDEISAACDGASRVIAAWGAHGKINARAELVRERLVREGVKLEALGFTDGGQPLHPLSRGKKFIPIEREPVPWQ